MDDWMPIETAPPGYDGRKFVHVLFSGHSKSGAVSGRVYVSGWMDSNRRPIHNYAYKLVITHWMPLPAPPGSDHDGSR
jgi:hypothetical protein